MAMKKLSISMATLMFLVLVLAIPHGEAAMTCNNVYNTLYPCLSYVMGSAPLQQTCCGGIRSVYMAAQTTNDRRSVCSCLKNIAANANGNAVYLRNAAGLPSRCGVNLPYTISPSINCASVR